MKKIISFRVDVQLDIVDDPFMSTLPSLKTCRQLAKKCIGANRCGDFNHVAFVKKIVFMKEKKKG